MSERTSIRRRKAGRSIASNGYVLIRVGKDHHLSDVRGYAYEHRLVAERKLGRRLLPREIAHHINGIKTDNRPENLKVLSCIAEHRQEHRQTKSNLRNFNQPNFKILCACGCGSALEKFDATGRPRTFVSGHNPHDLSKQGSFLDACSNGSRLNEVAEKTGQSLQAAKVMASKLVAEGKIQRISRGIYGRINRHLVV